MLKIMQGNKFFTVFLLSAITIMITIAFVFWGIGPKDNPSVAIVAQIEDEKITIEDFWRAYDNEYKRLKEQYPDPKDIEKLNLEDRVLLSLIDRSVLQIAAEQAGMNVSEKEIQNSIINTPYFQRNGVFDQSVYRRALKLNRLTPQVYENSIRNDMLITKISRLIGETTELSKDELKIIDSMKGGNSEQLNEIFRSSKNRQNIAAYIESFKQRLDITINRDLIS